MTTLGEAILYLFADDTGLKGDLDRSRGETESWASSLGSSISTVIGGAVVGAVALGAAAFVGLGVAGFNASMEIDQAQRELQGTLGVTADEAEWLGDVGIKVFKDGFAGSLEEAIAAVGEAQKALGELSDQELADATENAYRLSDAFGVDVNEGLTTAGVLMEEFGLTQQEAFDLMASGFQNGLNSSDDFLDSIGEYSNLFSDAGFSADEFYSIMETGSAGGVLGTDKISDAIKEMQLRLNEGGTDVAAAFEEMGLNFDQISASVSDGSATWADYFPEIVTGLQSIEDPIERNRLQVDLFGTQAQDLGVSFTEGLDPAKTSLEDMGGSIDKVDRQYENFGAVWEGVSRRVVIAIVPITDMLLDLANDAMPYVLEAVDWFEAQVRELLPVLDQWAAWFFDEGIPAIMDFVVPIIQELIPGLQLLGEIVYNVGAAIMPYLIDAFLLLADNMNIVLPILGVVGALILALSSPITFVAGLVVLLATAWANNWYGIQDITQSVMDFIMPYIETTMTAIQAIVTMVLDYIAAWWNQHGAAVMTIVNFVYDSILSYIETQINTIQVIIATVTAVIQAIWDAWGANLIAIAELYWSNIQIFIETTMNLIGYIIDAIAALIQGDWEAFGEAIQNIWEITWNAVQEILDNSAAILEETMTILAEALLAVWDGVYSDFVQVGTDIIDGIAQGIEDGWDYLTDLVSDLANSLLDAAKDTLGISSPSTLFADIGKNIQAGLALGIEQNSYMPEAAMGNTSQRITNNTFNQTINTSNAGNAATEFNQMRALIGT